MADETFIFLGQPYNGNAYRKTNGTVKQYCKIPEIIGFINDSVSNNTLNKGVKYFDEDSIRFKYKFIKGSNKQSVSVIIHDSDYSLYKEEINTLDKQLSQLGLIKKYNLSKINKLLDNPLALLTYTDTVVINN